MENTPNPKCPRCHCYWKPDENDIKSSGIICKCCKKCRENGKKYAKKYYENNTDERKEYKKKYYEENADKIKENKKKYYENNANKCKERIKKWRENNSDKILEYNKKYYEDNPDKIKEINKKWREKNKCEHDKAHGYCKICDKCLYLIKLQRVHLYNCLKNSNLEKTKPSISYLDCSAEYFVEYFEKKMNIWNENNEIKMNWDNIHIDHIKPVNAFDIDDEEEFLKCCHYSNMQPLLVEDNLSKSCKWTDEDDMYWNDNIIYKEYLDAYIPV
tara:strand:+ start:81 stop:896 length:816 start_codon:yes stop_codon:yes gene_type:complete